MFKLTITLFIVAALAVATEQKGYGKFKPGNVNKPGFNKAPVDCSSTTLPDFSSKLDSKIIF